MKTFSHGLLLAALLLLACGCSRKWIGGISSRYSAVDQDPWLTVQAGSALPLVEALQRYLAQNGHYPKEEADLVRFMSLSSSGSPTAWHYVPEISGYRLFLQLGWDPSLVYEQSGTAAQWIFDPGDGSPEKEIVLQPWPDKPAP